MIGRLTLLAGAAAFATLWAAPGAIAATTTVHHTTTNAHAGPQSDASEDNPDTVPDSDVDAAEREINQQLHDARMQVTRKGNVLVVSMGADILFTFDSYVVSNEGQAAAKALARVLNRHPRASVVVNGYTDTHGPTDYNQRLSENRADAVAQILEANGVDRSRVGTNGYGETHLAVDTPDETKEIKNRRVEIVINGLAGRWHGGRHGNRHRHNRNNNGNGDDN